MIPPSLFIVALCVIIVVRVVTAVVSLNGFALASLVVGAMAILSIIVDDRKFCTSTTTKL